MDKRNKLFIYLLILGIIALLNGSYLKINGNPNADIVLACGLLMKLIAVLGLVFTNIQKLRLFFKR